jgi:hypothetical protein
MRFQIGDRTYNVDAINKASLTDILNLKKFTGLTLAEVQEGHARLQSFTNPEDALSDTSALMALGAAIWLARWKGGDKLTFEEACDFPLDELVILPDPGDQPAEQDADPSL